MPIAVPVTRDVTSVDVLLGPSDPNLALRVEVTYLLKRPNRLGFVVTQVRRGAPQRVVAKAPVPESFGREIPGGSPLYS